jgi:VPDSG-CTERM motif
MKVLAIFLTCVLVASTVSGGVSFTDSTFNLGNYSATPEFKSNPLDSISAAQCPSCGNPGSALQIQSNLASLTDFLASGFINNTFSYNPQTQGAIGSIDASVDKNIITSLPVDPTSTFGNTFRPLIEQNGMSYLAAISGPNFHGGTTGFNTLAQSGLVATDFTQFDFTNGTFGSAHPDFAGSQILFGVAQLSGGAVTPIANVTFEADYDNLRLQVNSVPDSGATSCLLLGSIAALVILRRTIIRRQISPT